MEIIDFHTHPFDRDAVNICSHIANCNMSVENTRELYSKLGVSRICGSVIIRGEFRPKDMTNWEVTKMNNNTALALSDLKRYD